MIPFDSFLLDPPMLFGNGMLIGRLFGDHHGERRSVVRGLEALTIAGDVRSRVRTGLDVELGVFSFDHTPATPATHAVSAAILATYPWWLAAGVRTGARWRRWVTRGAGSPTPSSGSP
jgi:hypothetical protein